MQCGAQNVHALPSVNGISTRNNVYIFIDLIFLHFRTSHFNNMFGYRTVPGKQIMVVL